MPSLQLIFNKHDLAECKRESHLKAGMHVYTHKTQQEKGVLKYLLHVFYEKVR